MADFDRLLLRTSRTFALAIPLLPERLRHEVTVAYLLFRIADTFEDATRWPRSQRIAALRAFHSLLRTEVPPSATVRVGDLAREWVAARPSDHEGYLELLGETPAVIAAANAFAPRSRDAVLRHTLRTVEGMERFVASGTEDGSLALLTLDDLRVYCHVVAGIVGELLTELFLAFAPSLDSVAAALMDRANTFGEALQLVNILKDSAADARAGRVYCPPVLERRQVLELARSDLRAATDYVLLLQTKGAPRGIVAFSALPVLLARATLDKVERCGPGTSIRRSDVMEVFTRLQHDLDRGAPALVHEGPAATPNTPDVATSAS